MTAPTKRDFERALREMLATASRDKTQRELIVGAGDLHRRVGGYPDNTGHTNRMPTCCSVMKAEMQDGDDIIDGPPSCQGASLVIRYRFPRVHRLATIHTEAPTKAVMRKRVTRAKGPHP